MYTYTYIHTYPPHTYAHILMHTFTHKYACIYIYIYMRFQGLYADMKTKELIILVSQLKHLFYGGNT